MVRTNETVYDLDFLKLNHDFDLIYAQLESKSSYKQFQKDISKLKLQALTAINSLRYVILFKKNEFVEPKINNEITYTKVDFGIFNKKTPIYENNIVQLMINQLAIDEVMLPEKSITPYLFVGKGQQPKILADDLKQMITLKVSLNWEKNFEIGVTTFTEISKIKKVQEVQEPYVWDNNREQMQRTYDYGKKERKIVLYERHNGHKKNLINYLSLEDLENFSKSKIGILNQLLDEMNTYFNKYFLDGFKLKERKEEQFVDGKLAVDVDNIWDHLQNKTINLFFDPDDLISKQLTDLLMAGFQDSELLKWENITITCANQAVDGLNIQVIRDARKDMSVDERYQLGQDKKIIQHITPDGLGNLNHKTNKVNWKLKKHKVDGEVQNKDIVKSPEIINTFLNLIVKNDIRQKQMTLVSGDLLKLVSCYEFFSFEWIKKGSIKVIKLSISSEGTMLFDSDIVSLENYNRKSELAHVVYDVADTIKSKEKKYHWDRVDCVIKSGSDYLLITQTSIQVVPLQDEIKEREIHFDSEKIVLKNEVIKDLKTFLSINHQTTHDEYNDEDVNLLIAAVKKISTSVVSIGEIKDQLKLDSQISFKKKKFRSICRDLEKNFNYTFNNSVRQKDPTSLFPGFDGIGITRYNNAFLYYVGTKRSSGIKQEISKAIKFRKITALTGDDKVILDSFGDIAKMMSVDFVRLKQLTVIPFPMKYLREYDDYQDRLLNQNKSL